MIKLVKLNILNYKHIKYRVVFGYDHHVQEMNDDDNVVAKVNDDN